MIDKTDLEKVELANDLLLVLKSASVQDQIDILQLALDSMLAKKRLNEPKEKKDGEQTWMVPSSTERATIYTVTLSHDLFSCTCPEFMFKPSQCKHIRKVRRKIAGEKQKNKLPGVE